MRKVILVCSTLVLLALILISIPYINFMKLEIYDYDVNTGKISKDGIEYITSTSLPSDIEIEQTIGRCRQDKFFGFKNWIVKIKGIDEKEQFLLRGLMYEALYVRKDKSN